LDMEGDRMTDCLFCRIIGRLIPAKIVYEDDRALAFDDVNPAAPVHVLVVPKIHVATLNDMGDTALAGHLLAVTAKVAGEKGVAKTGYRVVVNVNRDAMQSVFHVHIHLIGGRPLGWPPG